MPGGNGFTLLKNLNPVFQLIFTTAHADYAIKATICCWIILKQSTSMN